MENEPKSVELLKQRAQTALIAVHKLLYFPKVQTREYAELPGTDYNEKERNLSIEITQAMAELAVQKDKTVPEMIVFANELCKDLHKSSPEKDWILRYGTEPIGRYIDGALRSVGSRLSDTSKMALIIDYLHVMESDLEKVLEQIDEWRREVNKIKQQITAQA